MKVSKPHCIPFPQLSLSEMIHFRSLFVHYFGERGSNDGKWMNKGDFLKVS